MQSAQDWATKNVSGAINDRHLITREPSACCVYAESNFRYTQVESALLNVGPAADPLARLRIIKHSIRVVDFIFDLKSLASEASQWRSSVARTVRSSISIFDLRFRLSFRDQ
jgi:hypothetical protein